MSPETEYHFTFRGQRIPRCVVACASIAEQMSQTPASLQMCLDACNYSDWFDPQGNYRGDDENGIGVEVVRPTPTMERLADIALELAAQNISCGFLRVCGGNSSWLLTERNPNERG